MCETNCMGLWRLKCTRILTKYEALRMAYIFIMFVFILLQILKCFQVRSVDTQISVYSFIYRIKVSELVPATSLAEIKESFLQLVNSQSCQGAHNKQIPSSNCKGIVKSGDLCINCKKRKRLDARKQARALSAKNRPLKPKTALSNVSKSKLSSALKQQRLANKKMKKEVEHMKKKLENESIDIGYNLHNSLKSIMDSQNISNPLAKLFWEEQKKNFGRTNCGKRWHPMIIRMALLLHSQSPQSYRSLRELGVIALPGESTLRDYSNYITPKQGFQIEVRFLITM